MCIRDSLKGFHVRVTQPGAHESTGAPAYSPRSMKALEDNFKKHGGDIHNPSGLGVERGLLYGMTTDKLLLAVNDSRVELQTKYGTNEYPTPGDNSNQEVAKRPPPGLPKPNVATSSTPPSTVRPDVKASTTTIPRLELSSSANG